MHSHLAVAGFFSGIFLTVTRNVSSESQFGHLHESILACRKASSLSYELFRFTGRYSNSKLHVMHFHRDPISLRHFRQFNFSDNRSCWRYPQLSQIIIFGESYTTGAEQFRTIAIMIPDVSRSTIEIFRIFGELKNLTI